MSPEAEERCPRGLAHIYAHTNHIIASSNLDPDGIARVLERIRSLASVRYDIDILPLQFCKFLTNLPFRWHYADANFQSGRFWLPSDVLNLQQTQLHKTKLYVEDLPLRDFDGNLQNTYVRAIPTDLLVSLKMAHSAPPLTTRLGSLKNLLLRSPQLEIFHYQDRGQGTQLMFNGKERLPPLRELRLKSYDWRHTQDDVSTHWDFSRIRSLELISVPLFNFLSSVSFADFADLHTLHVEDFSAHLPDHRLEATRGLYVLVKQHIKALHTLNITCHTDLFPMDGILAHAASLQSLHFRDHVGFSDEDRRCPTLWADDVVLLSRRLARLHTLELDMDVALCDPPLFLRALCGFPRLYTLTLHVQTVLHPLEVVYPGTDRDCEAVTRMFDFLVRSRAAAKDGVPWRSVTINVGGWRKLMVRRLGEPWRRQNARGVFAERCFVLEREAMTGHTTVREEMAVEVGQSREG